MANIFSPFFHKATNKTKPGLYHYISPQDDPRNYRLHLRVEEDGSGILIINASTILHLNRTATDYAFYLIKNEPADIVAKKMHSRYQIDVSTAYNDYQKLISQIQTLINSPDLDPETFLDIDRQLPFTGSLSAPYRLDCALTYQLSKDVSPDLAPTKNVSRELTTEEWKTIFDKAFKIGIPHIVFTGGEPTLRNDLIELISHAESNDQITGLLTDGSKLTDKIFLHNLLITGLDHIMIILDPENQQAWKALENCSDEDIFVAVHITITEENKKNISKTISKIAETETKAISLSIQSNGLVLELQSARNQAAELGLDLVWNLPVPYSKLNPVGVETDILSSEKGAGRAWLYVEPDGDVLPTQGSDIILGNMLTDPWDKIWKQKTTT